MTSPASKPAFTPGPWEAKNFGYEKFAVMDGRGTDVAFAHRRRDARLIAAAPDLYEALEAAREVIQEERDIMVDCATAPPEHDIATLDPATKPYVDEYDAALAKIDTALSRARGEHD